MSLTLQTAPAGAVLSTAEAKLHLRVSTSSEDALIDSLVLAATQDAEHLMQRAILSQQWLLKLDGWCSPIILTRPTVTTVNTVSYTDASGTVQQLASNAWQLDADDLCARLLPAYGTAWPAARAQLAAVQVLYTTGWANAAAVPALIKAWIKLRLTALYENRSAWTEGRAIESNPFTDRLLDRWSVPTL